MSRRIPEISLIVWGDRHLPGDTIMDQARLVAASGSVDGLSFPDHMVNFIPPSLWTPANTPMAGVLSDPDSLHDAVVMGTLAHAAAPLLDISFATDAIRRGPADMYQTMLSLAAVMEGRVRFQFGAGEAKQCKPYGHKRSQGLARLEDLLRVSQALWEADGPIDLEGNHWTLKQAYLGGAKPYRPEIWSMGTGPKQLDLATTYCDGISSSAPLAWTSAEHAGAEIERLKRMLEAKGRDPDSVGFGIYCPVIVHEDQAAVDAALDNPIVRWMSAIYGRVNPSDWLRECLEPATPDGWTYYMRYVPYETSATFVSEVVGKASREMAEKSFIHGTPIEVAEQLRAYADVGVTWICIVDFTAVVADPADAANSLSRQIAVCEHLKGSVVTAAGERDPALR